MLLLHVCGAVPEWLRERTATPRTSVRVRPASPAHASPRLRVAGVAGLACAAYPRRPMGKTTDFGSVNLGSSPSGGAKGGCANALPASTVDAPRGGREAHFLWVIFIGLLAT